MLRLTKNPPTSHLPTAANMRMSSHINVRHFRDWLRVMAGADLDAPHVGTSKESDNRPSDGATTRLSVVSRVALRGEKEGRW